jgi:hypothetical protein
VCPTAFDLADVLLGEATASEVALRHARRTTKRAKPRSYRRGAQVLSAAPTWFHRASMRGTGMLAQACMPCGAVLATRLRALRARRESSRLIRKKESEPGRSLTG